MLSPTTVTHQSCPGSFCSAPVSWVMLTPPCRALGQDGHQGFCPSTHPPVKPKQHSKQLTGFHNSGDVLYVAWTSPGFPCSAWQQDLSTWLMEHQGAGRPPGMLSHIVGHVPVLPPLHSLLLLWFCLHPGTKGTCGFGVLETQWGCCCPRSQKATHSASKDQRCWGCSGTETGQGSSKPRTTKTGSALA